jgi:hypothetical protein
MQPPTETSQDQVEVGIKKVRAFCRLGSKSLKQVPGRMKYRGMEQQAEKHGVSQEHLRKARVAADADRGYSEVELNDLFEQCRTAQFPIGPTFLIRLLSVPKGTRRLAIQRRAVKLHWSVAKLESQIAKQYGARNSGGRRRNIPSDPIDALVQLESLTEEWIRWRRSLSRNAGHEEKVSARDFSRPVRQQINRVAEQIEKLHTLVAIELGKANPRRTMRGTA